MSSFLRHKKLPSVNPKANSYAYRLQKWKYKITLLFSFFLLLIVFIRFYTPLYEKTQQELFEKTALIQSSMMSPFYKMRTFFNSLYQLLDLKEEYGRLVQENDTLKWHAQEVEALRYENKLLREYLQAPLREEYKHTTARVLATPYDGLHHFFLIAAGKKDGLTEGQAVITREGVVGRLEKVGRKITRVLLVNDSNSRIPVVTSQSQQKAIMVGNGTFFPTLVYVSNVYKIQPGEKVMTSGAGGVFPTGLPIGVIESITNGNVKIRPYVPFRQVDWVHILDFSSEDFTNPFDSTVRIE